jgi:hypothetical protein
MSESLLDYHFWITLGLVLLCAVVLAAVITFVASTRPKPWFWLLFALSVLGITAGWLTGDSREAAVGDVVPAVLTFIGGLSTYLAVRNADDASASPVALSRLASCTLGLALSFFLGALLGSYNRSLSDSPTATFERLKAEEHNRFLLELLKMDNEERLKKFQK